MLIKLRAINYATSYGLVNGVDGIFQDYTKTSSKSFIWIYFEYPKTGNNTRLNFFHLYKQFPRLDRSWIGIEWNFVEIQIGSNCNHTIKRIQYTIQLATTKV